MTWLSRFLHKSRSESHLDKELRFHIEQQIADSIARCRDRDESVD